MWPGPAFEVRSGSPVRIKYHNDALPTTHPLPVDFTIHGSEADKPQVRNLVHLHRAKILPESDGYRNAWISPNGITGPVLYNPDPFVYPDDQSSRCSGTVHTLGITRLNMIMGLAGAYIISDGVEDSINLPKGDFEIPLIMQDRLFNPGGTLLYPVAIGGTHDFWIPEFFGDAMW